MLFNKFNQNRTTSKTEVFLDGEDIVTRVTIETREKKVDQLAKLDVQAMTLQAQKAQILAVGPQVVSEETLIA